jgi:hypothetical protein
MARNKFQATDSRGQVHTRTSQNRTYTHCVVIHFAPWVSVGGMQYPAYSKAEWAGKASLAEKNAGRWLMAAGRRNSIQGVEVLAAERRG